jgi:hypothetical protein
VRVIVAEGDKKLQAIGVSGKAPRDSFLGKTQTHVSFLPRETTPEVISRPTRRRTRIGAGN